MPSATSPRYILTLSCPDTTGVVAAVAGFLASQNALITEAQHYDDPVTNASFMRTVFHDNGKGMPAPDELQARFVAQVATAFGMHWQFHEASRRCRVLVAVSKHGHCLNSLLHRWSTGTLPIDITGVVSNHDTLRDLCEWHRIPFYHLPIEPGGKRAQERQVEAIFDGNGSELLVLARYMQILSDEACATFAGRAINIHHSFLPGFKGARPYHQAHARGVKLIGATAHYVTANLDEGPIIEQDVERVDHTLQPEEMAVIGSELENVVLNRAIKWHAERRVVINGNRTVVLR